MYIREVRPNDWDAVRVNFQRLGSAVFGATASPTYAGLTLTGLTASTLVGANASKALESVTIGTGLAYSRPTLSLSHLGIEDLTDPNADRILFWDDSETASGWLTVSTGLQISTTSITTKDSEIVHDNLSGFVADEHIAHSGVTLTAGTGLTGGGDITANRTFAVDGLLEDLDTLGASTADGEFLVATGAGTLAWESGATARTSIGLGTGDSPTFAGLSLGTGELTCGSINRAADTLTLEIGGTAEISITSTTVTLGGNLIIPDSGTIGSASDTDVMTIDASGNTTFTVFPITPSAAPDADYEVANKKYVDDNAGAGTFVGLTDTPANFTGSGGKLVTVNSTPDALEFTTINDLTAETAIVTSADYYMAYDASASAHRKVLVPIVAEKTTRTVNLDNSMSTAEIQAEIDAVGKYIASGITITFQFADGTYTLTDTLYFRGFFGPGEINIYGNTGETNATDLHTTQEVYLDHSSYNGACLAVIGNSVSRMNIYNIKASTKTDSADADRVLDMRANFGAYYPRYCYFLGTSTAQGYCVYQGTGPVIYGGIYKCYVSNAKWGICIQHGSHSDSNTNDDTGTQPLYGIAARYNAQLLKVSTQPAGSTANEYTDTGGTIVS